MFNQLHGKSLLTHLFFISFFLIVPTLAFVRPPDEPFFAWTKPFVQDTVANFVLLCFFYLNYYLLLPKLFFIRKYVSYVMCVILFLTIALSVPQFVGQGVTKTTEYLQPDQAKRMDKMFHQTANNNFLYFMFLELRHHLYLFFTAVFFSFLLKTREHLAELKAEKLEVELSSLKSQINPHFLFNTLNSIYALSVKKDDRASNAIINLAGLMRYVMSDANNYKIPLEKEIDYITNYVELQEARRGKTTVVHFECRCEASNKEITPLILITYIENAFKYGVNPDVDNCIVEIILQVTETGILLHTFNKKAQNNAEVNSTGIGMQNTRKRLQQLYPEKHVLDINENEETYSVTLSLELI